MSRGPKSKVSENQYQFDDIEAAMYLLDLIVSNARMGGATRVGFTKDGGALAIGMYCGSKRGTEYVKPAEDLGKEIKAIFAGWGIHELVYDDDAGTWV